MGVCQRAFPGCVSGVGETGREVWRGRPAGGVLALLLSGFASTLLRPHSCAFILLPCRDSTAMFFFRQDRRTRRLLGMPPSFQAGFLLSTVLGLLINLSSFWALRVTTGTTYSFVGASNKIPSAVLGHFLFSSDLTTLG